MTMKKITDKLISKLDRRLSEERRDNPYEKSLVGVFTFGRHIVRYVFKEKGCELEIYNPVLDTFLDNVAEQCEKKVISWNDVDMEDDGDIWDNHGFRNEADYIRYRYG